MKMKRTVRPVPVSFASFIILTILVDVSPGPVFCGDRGSNDGTATQRVSEPGYVQFYSAGFLDRLFGFKRRSGSPEQHRSAGSAVKSAPLSPAKDHPPLRPNESLTSGIQRGTPAKRAAALRLAEKGRQYLLQKQHRQAVTHLEKALGLEASPYVYYYLSRAHYYLGHYGESANFLDVAAALLAPRPEWATVFAAMRAQYIERARKDKERVVARARAVRAAGALDRSGM